ncbi:MAG: hypothetical protein ACI4A5_03765 [Hominilimicola sp.]
MFYSDTLKIKEIRLYQKPINTYVEGGTPEKPTQDFKRSVEKSNVTLDAQYIVLVVGAGRYRDTSRL